MKPEQNWRLVLCACALLALGGAHAQDSSVAPPSTPPKRSAAELEKLVAPIALHPDPLIAIILPASVYPLEIVQAARFVQDTNNVSQVDSQPWDANVKALAKFPAMTQKMNDDLSWTMSLGEAFLDQQKELMDTIQALRAKAQGSGVLKTTPQQVIVVTNTVIEKTVEQKVVLVTNTVVQIQPANPQVVYVPTYPPTIYYPPPVATGPPPILTFAAGIAVGAIIANNCDWHGGGVYVGGYSGGDVDINVDNSVNIGNNNTKTANTVNNTKATQNKATGQKWQPDQNRVRASGTPASTKSMESRGYGSANATVRPSAQPATANRSAGAMAANPSAGTRPANPTAGARPSDGSPSAGNLGASARTSASPAANRASAFSGGDQAASQRGAASRGGGGSGAGGGSRGGSGGGGSRSGGGGARSGGGR